MVLQGRGWARTKCWPLPLPAIVSQTHSLTFLLVLCSGRRQTSSVSALDSYLGNVCSWVCLLFSDSFFFFFFFILSISVSSLNAAEVQPPCRAAGASRNSDRLIYFSAIVLSLFY